MQDEGDFFVEWGCAHGRGICLCTSLFRRFQIDLYLELSFERFIFMNTSVEIPIKYMQAEIESIAYVNFPTNDLLQILKAECTTEKDSMQPIVEITSSGLTHSWRDRLAGNALGKHTLVNLLARSVMLLAHKTFYWNYIWAYYLGKNAAVLDIDFDKNTLSMKIIDSQGRARIQEEYSLSVYNLEGVPFKDCAPWKGYPNIFQEFFGFIAMGYVFVLGPVACVVLALLRVKRKWKGREGTKVKQE